MATIVQAKGTTTDPAGSHNTLAVTVDAAVTSGNAVIGFCTTKNNALYLNHVTDDQSNTYTVVDNVGEGTHDYMLHSFYCLNVTNAPSTITATFDYTPTHCSIVVAEVSGLTASPLDQHGGQAQTTPGTGTDGVTSGNVTTTADGEMIIGMVVDTSATRTTNYTAGTGFSIPTGGQIGGASSICAAIESRTQASQGAVAATFTQANNDDDLCVVMTFKAAATGPTAISTSDTLAILSTEISGPHNLFSFPSDAFTIVTTGAIGSHILTSSITDTITILLSDTAEIYSCEIDQDIVDTANLILTEAATVQVSQPVLDACAISVDGVYALAVQLAAADAILAAIEEASDLDVAFSTVSDTLAPLLAEMSASSITTYELAKAVNDLLTVTLGEAYAGWTAADVADTIQVVLDESATASLAGVIAKAVADILNVILLASGDESNIGTAGAYLLAEIERRFGLTEQGRRYKLREVPPRFTTKEPGR